MNLRKHQTSGFTLVELMVTVLIIGILAGIAFPSYQRYVVRTKRADAQKALLALAQGMERHFLANNSYLGAASAGGNTGAPTVGLARSPENGDIVYNLSITAATATSYTLRATAVGGQARDGFLQIGSDGLKSWDKNNDGTLSAAENTWDR